MTALLTLLLGWPFAGDVAALGDPHYHARAAADRRLSLAGWRAYPAMLDGLTSDTPERADRCERLIARLPGPLAMVQRQADLAAGGLLRSAAEVPELTPAAWLLLEGAVCRAAERAGAVRVGHPTQGYATELRGRECRGWAGRPCYFSGSHAGDVRLLAEAVRRGRGGACEGEGR
jgi:hypothetical protein